MKTIKHLIKSGLWVIWIVYETLILFSTSCRTRENAPESLKTSQTSSLTLNGEKPLTSEISGQIDDVSEIIPTVTNQYAITDEERHKIERIVASEGGYCPYEFQALVAECILNGCEAENMRPTEIFERGDFWLTHNVEPTETTRQAVSDVFDKGILPTEEKIRWYYNPNFCDSELHESMRYVLTNCDCRFFADWG